MSKAGKRRKKMAPRMRIALAVGNEGAEDVQDAAPARVSSHKS